MESVLMEIKVHLMHSSLYKIKKLSCIIKKNQEEIVISTMLTSFQIFTQKNHKIIGKAIKYKTIMRIKEMPEQVTINRKIFQ